MAKILIADDKQGLRDVLVETLAGSGHEVESVEDGTRALRLLLDAGHSIRAFREEEAALAEVFLELTRGEVA